MVSHPETGSDSPIGSDRDQGHDRMSPGDVATLADIGCMSYDLNFAMSQRRDVEAEHSSNLLLQISTQLPNVAFFT